MPVTAADEDIGEDVCDLAPLRGWPQCSAGQLRGGCGSGRDFLSSTTNPVGSQGPEPMKGLPWVVGL